MGQESSWKEVAEEIRQAQRHRRYVPSSDWGLLILGLILFCGGLVVLGVSLARLWRGS